MYIQYRPSATSHSQNYAWWNNSLKVGVAPVLIVSLHPTIGSEDLQLKGCHAHFLASYFAVRNCASAMLRLGGTVPYLAIWLNRTAFAYLNAAIINLTVRNNL